MEGVVQTALSANKWAVKVDLSEDVEDFYEKVPNMAHTVGVQQLSHVRCPLDGVLIGWSISVSSGVLSWTHSRNRPS